MIQLTPEQQAMLMQAAPTAFAPVPGGWGRLEATNVCSRTPTKPSLKVLSSWLGAMWLQSYS
jgi:hypothetical protein